MTSLPFDYEGPQALEETVAAALRQVVDPEIALNIVDVGLVQSVALIGDELQVRLIMTTRACPLAEVIVEDVERTLDGTLPPELFIRVTVVSEPPWSPERMTESGRRLMGW